jgi:hypothetical protein
MLLSVLQKVLLQKKQINLQKLKFEFTDKKSESSYQSIKSTVLAIKRFHTTSNSSLRWEQLPNSPAINRLREALKKDFESHRDFLKTSDESAVPTGL